MPQLRAAQTTRSSCEIQSVLFHHARTLLRARLTHFFRDEPCVFFSVFPHYSTKPTHIFSALCNIQLFPCLKCFSCSLDLPTDFISGYIFIGGKYLSRGRVDSFDL